MGYQVIKQPDGKLAIFSSGTDRWAVYDGTPEEIIQFFVDRAARDAKRSAEQVVDAVIADEPRSIYFQFALTFKEADETHRKSGGETVPFEYLQQHP
ncbi:hypothetical protein Back2_17740 [Nocardioides baekrokdamisoli]|uniref:Uncharacterized protein n=1 Tax=Nocardioides baekrokdamisoli TaxID=1804624 RepID=A0A3G9IEY0_9ACTN|nr:hypothetical protein [Nocardioides baekrokdamisoli]BBH17487.1 hypothetical protein Back2_17740 [Nocardioides baekrokdamisoli]